MNTHSRLKSLLEHFVRLPPCEVLSGGEFIARDHRKDDISVLFLSIEHHAPSDIEVEMSVNETSQVIRTDLDSQSRVVLDSARKQSKRYEYESQETAAETHFMGG